MITATRNWLRRNRTNFAVGLGVLGVGYVAGQYVISKITEAGQRMSNDRTAKENLRRRFQQNQEDCTITVLALLPTATENIIDAVPVESITNELQQKKVERLGRSTGTLDTTPSELSSGPPSVTDEDGKSLASFQSGSYVHASQTEESSLGAGDSGSTFPSKSKIQLWNELKINSITRSFTLLYTLCFLTLLTRIQLNLLGRRNYLSSVVSSASRSPHDPKISLENHDDDNAEQPYGNDFETNRQFLTFSWWLLHRGCKDMMEKVQSAVKEVFGPLNPREDIYLERLSSLILDVRRKVEGATPEERKTQKWLSYLLPPTDQEITVLRESGMFTPPNSSPPQMTKTSTPAVPPDSSAPSSIASISPPLRHLLDETSDLIDSPPFSQILTILLDTTFSHLTDAKIRSQAFKLPLSPLPRIQEVSSSATLTNHPLPPTSSSSSPSSGPYDPLSARTKLASIMAAITKQAHAIGNGVPNEYVQAMEEVRELEAFAAVVYSSNFEFEAGAGAGAGMGDVWWGKREEVQVQQRQHGLGVMETATGVLENVWGRVVKRG